MASAHAHIQLITPTVPEVRTGNVFTAVRYSRILRRLGHRVSLCFSYEGTASDICVALHARRSYPSIRRFVEEHPDRPLVVVLTGTDLYHDIHVDAQAQESLELATRLVVLQPMGLRELPDRLRAKTRVIYQSTDVYRGSARPPVGHFRVSVIGHLRPEKDPFRAALAARQLPPSSRIRVLHVGAALSPDLEAHARREQAENARYRWAGLLPHWRTRGLIAASHVVAITSVLEGSSNVLCEALATPTPVVASRISGLIGTLGEDYPGYFPVQDESALAQLLDRAETDVAFYDRLNACCIEAAALVTPERERESWKALLAEVS